MMKFIRRDPQLGYVDAMLYVPKTMVNVEGVKSALTFCISDKMGAVRYLQLWEETEDHLIVPRALWNPADLGFEAVDCRPRHFTPVAIGSRIKLDVKNPNESVQHDAAEAILAATGGILQLRCGAGKGLPNDSHVLTPNGWARVDTIRVGDQLVGSDGNPTEVLGVFPQGVTPCYLLEFSDGTSVTCDENHLWEFTVSNRDKRVISTKELTETSLTTKAGKRFALDLVAPVNFTKQELPIDPWLLGIYLGDGSSCCATIVTNPEEDICDRILAKHAGASLETNKYHNRCGGVRLHQPFLHNLRSLQLDKCRSYEKFIPRIYLRSDAADRIALLQGLVDSDGYVSGGNIIEFGSSSEQLIEDFVELVRSLGGVTSAPSSRVPHYTYKEAKLEGRVSYRIHARFPRGDFTPVSSKKHLGRWKEGCQRKRKYLARIDPVEEKPTTCFRVAAEDELFVAEGYNLTHNTVIALHVMAKMSVPALIIVDNNNLMSQWAAEIQRHLDVPGGVGQIQGDVFAWKHPIVLSTYQTLASRAETFPEEVRRWFGVVIWDECHHSSAPIFCRSVNLFYGFRLGLSATPDRTDGTQIVYTSHMGGVLYKNLKQELIPRLQFIWTGLTLDLQDPQVRQAVVDKNGEVHLSKLSVHLGKCRERLEKIISMVRRHEAAGRKTMVLSNTVGELVNLLALYNKKKELYTDIPIPTPADFDSDLIPLVVSGKARTRMEMELKRAKLALHDPNLNSAKRAHIKTRLIPHIETRIKQHELAKNIEKELLRRQRTYIKDLIRETSDAGLMVAKVPTETRMEMLRSKKTVFTIYRYGLEGLDDAELDTIIAAEPMTSKNAIQQFVGRILRKREREKFPLVQFLEDNIGPYIGMCKIIRRTLREWPIDEGGPYKYELVDHPYLKERYHGKRDQW